MKTLCGLQPIAIGFILAIPGFGCGPNQPAPPVAPPAAEPRPNPGAELPSVGRNEGLADLAEVGKFYVIHQADGAQARDLVLDDVKKNLPKVYQAVQKGDYILLSGDPAVTPAGASNTIVAYHRDAPTKGGVVVTLDGSARTMTAQEFKDAAKLGQ